MIYKIVVDKQPYTNPSAEKREYTVDIEELRAFGNISDSLVITKDEDYVMRRISLTEYGVPSILSTPVKEPLTDDINIQLFEGDNYIYLYDMVGNRFFSKYIIKNDFTETYATTSELNSKIEVVAGTIMLEVNQKVNNEDYTAAKIVLMINQSGSEAVINADKINLTANDILNLISGNAINLTSKNIIITSDKFNVDKDGNVTCNNLSVLGGEITGASVDLNINDVGGVQIFRLKAPNHNAQTNFSGRNIQWIKTGQALPAMDIGVFSDSNKAYIDLDGDVTCEDVWCDVVHQSSLFEKKKNFEKLENALDTIKDIDIYKYNFKTEEDGTKKHIGFVIGDNFKYSEDVTSSNNDGVENYSFTSLCCKAIQEQQKLIEDMQKKIKELEGKING